MIADQLQNLFNNPNAPRIDNPTENQQAEIEGYWRGVIKHAAFILDMQKTVPNWLPTFNQTF